ncbi:MAG: DUF2225 domain-containing protein [Lachnospiraceae bacterium]|nr:DUF2225 domain-containing protein [Lachnospiraceae bacterium]
MAGLLDGLGSLGLGNLENMDVFEEEKKQAAQAKAAAVEEKKGPEEEELIYDKEFECPVCGRKFSAKVMKTGKAKLLGTDPDMRPKYEGIDSNKYDVLLCGKCGYASLVRYHGSLLPTQVKLIKENISSNIKLKKYTGPTYDYDQALERYKIALANAVVKKCKISERAFICLKTAWLIRGIKESGEAENKLSSDEIASYEAQEKEYLKNAYQGFYEARSKENPPIAGMDNATLDYLLAQLAFRFGDYGTSLKMVEALLTSRESARIKNKALDLKEAIKEAKAKAAES